MKAMMFTQQHISTLALGTGLGLVCSEHQNEWNTEFKPEYNLIASISGDRKVHMKSSGLFYNRLKRLDTNGGTRMK